ncbi:uncharacterized protein HD556DRAFT_1454247 [Suillus plorans]|uniref:Uncharacterized protein n=1 Tax=Suillus plorans TaxID=116603 RepID=A0A9P7E499_9AGAM|nr:uncharacterized protein HD556DRAFT_1454247 [Suillus plorans]KAG1810372.1 hypothetical protein HD556DRAFT_1454247 [Suillus plorans]
MTDYEYLDPIIGLIGPLFHIPKVRILCLRVHGVRVGAQTHASSRHRRTRAQDSPKLPVHVSLELLILPDGLGFCTSVFILRELKTTLIYFKKATVLLATSGVFAAACRTKLHSKMCRTMNSLLEPRLRPEPGQSQPSLVALARPGFFAGQSRLKPGQSRGFWAKPGRNITTTKSPIRLFWRDPVECLESLFSNPLPHDKLDFIPRRVYKTAERLLRVYSEWLTGDSAWEMQTQLPRGATVLGAVLSSDKTNITTMTGARPLMKAAEVGIMMSDPVGNVRHCFTPLAAYIVDTPEAAMLACVRGKTSPFTMASYLQFGDNFRHPAHTRSITLGQLANITVNPDDLEAYFEACADSRLNGVYAPFWMDWPLADPSIFLTPESLCTIGTKNFMTTIFSGVSWSLELRNWIFDSQYYSRLLAIATFLTEYLN